MNRHSTEDNNETISRSHHELLEEIAQLKEHERVLFSENDQLRSQLVEMKEEADKKYDDLMVQYNMKREYEDDGLDKQGTSNNQVTVKTESDDDEVKEVIKVEIKEEEDEENHDIFIKREYVPAYIKTESNDVKVEIKEEDEENHDIFIKREYVPSYIKTESNDVKVEEEEEDDEDNDKDREWDRRLAKKELNTVDMIEIKEEVEDGEETRIIDMETLTQDRQVKREIKEEDEMTLHNDQIGDWVKREIKEDGETQVDDIEGWAQDDQVGGDESANESNEVTTVTQSADLLSPSTSTGNGSNQTALNQQANASTQHNKRKQPPTKRSAKRSKKTLQDEDGDDGGDIANEDPEEAKIKVVYLNCTESNCNVKMTSLVHLHDHLSTVHQLSPFQCFADNCKSRFDNRTQIREHIKLLHPQDTRFVCAVCPKEFDSQNKAYDHWYQSHQNGQFKCNFVSDCTKVTDTRRKMTTHQRVKHYSQSKHCTHPGCTASFSCNAHLKRHEQTHLNTNQFHCNWPHCSKQCKLRTYLVKHIRTQHFGLPESMKAQKEKKIVDLRDPNEYVRVVVDE